jgi:hypothetical protein
MLSNMDTTRRSFLTATAAAPLILGATDKAGSKAPILGDGEYKYECIHDWGELPGNIKYGNTHGVCEDSHGNIYIHHTVGAASESNDTIVVFDQKGKFIRSWGKQYKLGAHGLHLRREGKDEYLYICDQLHGIVTKRTLKGEEVWTMGYPVESKPYEKGPGKPGLNYRPTNVAIAPNGDFFVGDGYGSSYIHKYNSKPELIATFGGVGKEPGQLNTPHGLMVDTRESTPVLLVADRTNRRIQRFTLDGKHINFVEGTQLPCHFHEQNSVVVVPDLLARVTLMGKDNKVISHLGDGKYTNPEWGQLRTKTRENFTPGKFVAPHSAIFDHAGNIFVVEWVEVGRVTKLRKVA